MHILIDPPRTQGAPAEVQAWRGIAERRLRGAARCCRRMGGWWM